MPILTTILASVGGILLEKGLGFITDLFSGMTDAGIDKAKTLISEKTGVDITNASQLVNLTEAQVSDIKEAMLANMVTIMEIKKQYRDQDLANTVSAREAHTIASRLGVKGALTFTNILSIILVLFSLAYVTAITFWTIPPSSVRFADTIIGFILGTLLSTVINFYFGSSMTDVRTRDQVMQRTADVQPIGQRREADASKPKTPDVIAKSFVNKK